MKKKLSVIAVIILVLYPEDCSYCHIPDEVLNKYRNQ